MTLLIATDVRHYFGGLCAVSGFNLTLNAGDVLGLIGPNGAGKTTIFNLITGVYHASVGSIQLRGVELIGKTPHEITTLRVARTFQNIRLFRDLTVLDNVRIAHYARARYNPFEALFRIGRYHREEDRIIAESQRLLTLFELDHLAHETAKNLPYGLQRRLEIARALATGPELLLLDEPAAGMNPNEIDQLIAFVRWIRTEFQITIILIEHQMRLVMGLCERILVLDFGETLVEGPPDVIRTHPKVLEAYLGQGSAQ